MVSMNRLSLAERVQVVRCLVEGNSIRSTVRTTGIAKNTVTKLLVELGAACAQYQGGVFKNLRCGRLQLDEIWSFVRAKQKNVREDMLADGHAGDVWTWTAIDAETKLVPCWMLGPRDAIAARNFVDDLAGRLATRVHITSDGLKVYVSAIANAFDGEVDCAQLVKVYGSDADGEKRYSPAVCIGCEKHTVIGNPNPADVSTSYVERQNLTMRIGLRRFTRLTNAFSKKLENHWAAIALHFMWYNFGRQHQTLKTTPAVAAGVTDHIWTVEEIVGLLGSN